MWNWPRASVVRSWASRWRAAAILKHHSWVPNVRTWPPSSAMEVWRGSSTFPRPVPTSTTQPPSPRLSLSPLLIAFIHSLIQSTIFKINVLFFFYVMFSNNEEWITINFHARGISSIQLSDLYLFSLSLTILFGAFKDGYHFNKFE